MYTTSYLVTSLLQDWDQTRKIISSITFCEKKKKESVVEKKTTRDASTLVESRCENVKFLFRVSLSRNVFIEMQMFEGILGGCVLSNVCRDGCKTITHSTYDFTFKFDSFQIDSEKKSYKSHPIKENLLRYHYWCITKRNTKQRTLSLRGCFFIIRVNDIEI